LSSTSNQPKKNNFLAGTANYVDERLGVAGVLKEFGRKIFPDHWSFMLGEVALYSFLVLLLSGTFLTFFFDPSMTEVVYDGVYAPLKGAHMSIAYASSLDITFEVRGGLLMRQVHHWSALLFVAAAGLHMLRVFFTGAFRKPREMNWVVGFVLFVLGMGAGFTGYSLPDDLLSGNGLRIIDGMIKGIPFIGTWISSFLFGGEFPGTSIVPRLYSLHIMLIPALILVFLAIHLVMLVVHKHTHYSGAGKKDTNIVGYPLMPVYVAKAGGFFFIVFEFMIGDFTVSMNILLPLAVSLIFLALVAVYPFIENWITGDKREHHVLDRPRNAPVRTAIGAAGVMFYAILWAGASTDLIATQFKMSLNQVLTAMQISLIVLPIVSFMVTKRICLSLQRKDREVAIHGRETGRIVRLPHGEYIEVHEPLNEYELYKLVDYKDYQPTLARPNAAGKITVRARIRASLSKFYFKDRVSPATQSEIEEARHHAEEIEQEVQKAIESAK